jgi:hypothetical protein
MTIVVHFGAVLLGHREHSNARELVSPYATADS